MHDSLHCAVCDSAAPWSVIRQVYYIVYIFSPFIILLKIFCLYKEFHLSYASG